MLLWRQVQGCVFGALLVFMLQLMMRPSDHNLRTVHRTTNNYPNITIYIHSGPALYEGRQNQRLRCIPEYHKYGLKAMFVVARPSFDTRAHDAHAQGQLGTTKEHELSESLLEESVKYDDILFLPHRDYYRDMTEKLLGYLKYDFEHMQSEFVFKTDDEYCLNMKVVVKLIETHKTKFPHKELYAGAFLWQGDEYEIMKGPHKEMAPFMSGAAFGISKGLVKNIAFDNWAHSSLYHAYGTSSDDANLGKWILYANETGGLQTNYVEEDLKYEF